MATLFNPKDRSQLLARIRSLGPESERRWGTMTVAKALCHMADQLATGLGDIQVRRIRSAMSLPPVRWFAIYWMPWPKGVKTAPELLKTDIQEIEPARERLIQIIDRATELGPEGAWSAHPLFGSISGRDWGFLGAKHLDHHLRQFGA